MKKIILASASPRRRELLGQIGLEFEICTSNCDEVITQTDPAEVVKELSFQKAADVYRRNHGDVVVIGADTIVYADGEILGKPGTEEKAYQMIGKLQGKTHSVYTGVTLIWNENNQMQQISFAEETKVMVHEMTHEEIEEYVATGDPMDKAGAYGIQGFFARFIDGIDGDYNNVVGLPVARVYQKLKKIL